MTSLRTSQRSPTLQRWSAQPRSMASSSVWESELLMSEGPRGAIRLRSNVVLADAPRPYGYDVWELVPGDIVEDYKKGFLNNGYATRSRQRDEAGYYKPCPYCKRLAYQIELEGCDGVGCGSARPSDESVRRT